MHRKSEAEFLPPDTEIEKTLKNLNKVRIVAKTTVMEKQEEINQNKPVVVA